jgi:hypothetical protein
MASIEVRNTVTATVGFMHSLQRKPSAPIRISAELSAILTIFFPPRVYLSPSKRWGSTSSWPKRFLANRFQFIKHCHNRRTECAHSVASLDGRIASSDNYACSVPLPRVVRSTYKSQPELVLHPAWTMSPERLLFVLLRRAFR